MIQYLNMPGEVSCICLHLSKVEGKWSNGPTCPLSILAGNRSNIQPSL